MMYAEAVRTTLKLDDDVAAAAQQLREAEQIGLSEAVNRLARLGLVRSNAHVRQEPFVQETYDLGLLVDVTNIAEVLELLDEQR
ncbi:MAG: CopG family transcriptional regulator [Nocardioidaceae bacterium]